MGFKLKGGSGKMSQKAIDKLTCITTLSNSDGGTEDVPFIRLMFTCRQPKVTGQ